MMHLLPIGRQAVRLQGFRNSLGRGSTSVIFNGGQFRLQANADVFVEAIEGNNRVIVKIVETVHVLPLFGIPQQFIPPKKLHLPSVVVRNELILANLAFWSCDVQTTLVNSVPQDIILSPHPQNALGKALILRNCSTVTPPKNSFYGRIYIYLSKFGSKMAWHLPSCRSFGRFLGCGPRHGGSSFPSLSPSWPQGTQC